MSKSTNDRAEYTAIPAPTDVPLPAWATEAGEWGEIDGNADLRFVRVRVALAPGEVEFVAEQHRNGSLTGYSTELDDFNGRDMGDAPAPAAASLRAFAAALTGWADALTVRT